MKKILFCFLILLVLKAYGEENKIKELRWGADANSGAPFVFRDSKDPNKVIGLDVDLVAALAKELNLIPVFVQNQWDGLIAGLQAGNYDLVADGLEIISDRKQSISFSEPYYYTYEQLVVNAKNNSIHSLQDLSEKNVGTLPASLAYRILNNVPRVNIKYYAEELNAFDDLDMGHRLDAVLLDFVIAKYYALPNLNLKFVGPPIGNMRYGIGIKKENKILQTQINKALHTLIEKGELKFILEKWGLWNDACAKAWNQASHSQVVPTAYEEFLNAKKTNMSWFDKFVQKIHFIPLLAKGALITIEISLLSMCVAIVVGLMIAIVRLYAPSFIRMFAIIYIELIRGTPLLIQLFLIFYGLPYIGIRFSPFLSAVIGLGLNYAANEAENYRAGILAVPKHQVDAALALGMSKRETLVHIVIPQALRMVIPPITNDFISLIKDSSLVSVITLVELTTVYNQLASTYFDYLGIGLLTALMYFCIGLPFARLSYYAEKKLNYQRRKVFLTDKN